VHRTYSSSLLHIFGRRSIGMLHPSTSSACMPPTH
jgi:hypothetical protein